MAIQLRSAAAVRQMPDPVSTASAIARALEGEIISGRYSPGARLVERELAGRFRVSPIPVREALQILESRGLVMKRLNRGCTVIDLSSEEMAQMCELRDFLEPKVMKWAACRRTDAGLAQLSERLRELGTAAASNDLQSFFAADLEFHRCLWSLAANPSASKALDSIVGCLFACGLRNASIDLPEQYAKHERLFQAVAGSRPSDAALLLADISQGFRRQLSRAVESPRATESSRKASLR
jgi:DNA-binding GntR family transcriptional regulator